MIVEYHREVKQNSEEDVKMIRRIIQIDREKCNGCGACAEACHEGAIAMVDGTCSPDVVRAVTSGR